MLCLEARSLGVPGFWVESMAQRSIHTGAWSQCGTREEVLANYRPAKQLWGYIGIWGSWEGENAGSYQQRDLIEATLETLHFLCYGHSYFQASSQESCFC